MGAPDALGVAAACSERGAEREPLIGRESELQEILGLLGVTRLLTLTGAGGIGKTTLARAAAERLATSRNVVFVELAPLPSGELVLGALLDAAGVRERPGRERFEQLVSRLAGEEALLVLDNCEHLAPSVAEIAESLLRHCRELRVLATSRQPLELAGETTWRTPPLSEGDAAALFSARSGVEVSRDVRRLCRELDGLPLAIELTAARVPAMSVAEALVGLDARLELLGEGSGTGLPQHRTMRASLEWSYALLDEPGRRALRSLSVLAGWTLESAAAVCGEWTEPAPLIAAGLVTAGAERHSMPEAVRAFALEKLAAAGEEGPVRERHLGYFRELALRADELSDDPAGVDVLVRETPNLLAALEFALDGGRPEALAIAAGLGLWWLMRDAFALGRSACARALARVAEPDPAREALVRWTAALLSYHAFDFADAHAQGAKALALAEASGDDRAIGRCLQMMATVLGAMEPIQAARLGERSVELLGRAGDRHGLAHSLIALASVENQRERFQEARRRCREFEALGTGHGHAWLRTWLHVTLSWAARLEAELAVALAQAEIALELAGDEPSLTRSIAAYNRLTALVLSGRAPEARRLGLAELAVAADAGLGVAVPILEGVVATAELALGQLDLAGERAARLYDERHLPMAGELLDMLARIAQARDDPAEAVERAAALRRVAAATGSERRHGLADLHDGIAALQQARLGQAAAHLHQAAARLQQHGFRLDAVDALEALGALAAAEGDTASAGRLLGAVTAARRTLGCVRIPPSEPWVEALAPGPAELVEGESMSLEDALLYATRGRGRRDRPLGGWESLTPTEAQVARLAAEGLTNPQIGERMFISRGTVKAHLLRVFDKLGVANRTELAGAAARREGVA